MRRIIQIPAGAAPGAQTRAAFRFNENRRAITAAEKIRRKLEPNCRLLAEQALGYPSARAVSRAGEALRDAPVFFRRARVEAAAILLDLAHLDPEALASQNRAKRAAKRAPKRKRVRPVKERLRDRP